MCELDTVRFLFCRHLERFTGAIWATDDDGAYLRFTARGVSLARQCAANWRTLRAIYKQRTLRANSRAG